jgi:DNA polymerase IIIc chi subunit
MNLLQVKVEILISNLNTILKKVRYRGKKITITRRDNGYRDFIEHNMWTYDKDNCH